MFADESEREQFFEAAKAQAQKDFQEDSTNAHALVRWGGALLELAHFKQGSEADQCIQDAITRLQQALSIDPERTDAEWCLGNAYTSMGFLAADRKTALQHFNKAEEYFKHCKEKVVASKGLNWIMLTGDVSRSMPCRTTHVQAQEVAPAQLQHPVIPAH
eukprot:GHRR01004809.1.p1 GENE.GHRR01004809.1~~GHRR01004809.1.p1  ORF type:complete len:160 (+),score=50.75 GHRR01004809.1:161-640(+)